MSSNCVLDTNLAVLRSTHPQLAFQLDSFAGKTRVRVLPSKDGSVFYGYEEQGAVIPITDSVAPIHRIQTQLNQYLKPLTDTTKPVLIVGLYPGNELLSIFDLCEQITTPHCPQPIRVCIDSMVCLYGFLRTWDARRLLQSPRVRLFWHGDMQKEVENLRQHPEIPHVFTLISGASDKTLNTILPPLVDLVQERERKTLRLCAENNDYYDRIDDRQMADIIEGKAGRRPRLMMPTCAWSTFIQHSTRDTCAAFENLGWKTLVLNMEAMLTSYHLVSQINAFKPDVFLFIDHLRYEAEEAYPRNLMFITWIQDEMGHIQCREAGRKLAGYAADRKRDLVVGYTESLAANYGYPKERLVPLNITADPRIFHPVTITASDTAKYGCELAFMSNVSMPTEQVAEEKILPAVEPLGISRRTVEAIHDHLWKEYRADKTIVDREQFLAELLKFDEFRAVWENLIKNIHEKAQNTQESESRSPLTAEKADELVRLFYWRLNDTIYRHVVLEWADALGANMHLYGQGWENHPRFRKYAKGPLAHGPDLNIAYQAARLNLHLNITFGMHQRIWEILSAGGRPLVRVPAPTPDSGEPAHKTMHQIARQLLAGEDLSTNQQWREVLSGWVFDQAYAMAAVDAEHPEQAVTQPPLEQRVARRIEQKILSRPDWMIPQFDQLSFTDQSRFNARLK